MSPTRPPIEKLSRPRLHNAIARERLFGLLDATRTLPATWIGAEPGSGKTALVSSYVEARGLPSIWYRVDTGDEDLSAFFFHMRKAAAAVTDAAGELPLLTPDYLMDTAGFARRFFRLMFGCLPGKALVAIDNLEEAPALGGILREMIEEIPKGIRVVFISRSRPIPGLARPIGASRLTLLDPAQLALTAEEATAIARRHGVSDPELTALLHKESEGWVVGLILLLNCARLEVGTRRAPTSVSRELLFDYFATEIFQTLPAATQDVLTRLSQLPTFTPAMAEALCAHSNVAALLDELYRARQFLTRQIDDGGTYRLHDLFRRFLHDQFNTRIPANERLALRRQAAALLRAQGDLDAAIRLLSVDQDWASIREVLLAAGSDLMLSGRWRTLEGWLATLPAHVIASDPWLTYWGGVSRSFSDPAGAKALLTRAYQEFARNGDRIGQYRAAIACMEGVVAQLTRYQDLDTWIAALEPLMAEKMEIDEDEELSGWYAFLYAALCRQPANPLVAVGIARLKERLLNERLGQVGALRAGVVLILYSCMAADHGLAREVIARVMPLATREDLPPVTRWLWSFWLGYYHMWRIEYERCTSCWENCFAISERHELHGLDFLPNAAMAMVDLVQDRIASAEHRLVSIRPAAAQEQEIAEGFYWLVETFRRVLRHRDDGVESAADRLLESTRNAGLFPLHILAMTDVAALSLLRGRNAQAESILAKVKQMVRGTTIRLVEGQIHAIDSTLAFRRGDRAAAMHSLDNALRASEELGTCGCLLWLRPGFGTLFAEALHIGLKSDTVQKLIRQYQIPAPSPLAGNWPWVIKVRSLGDLDLHFDDDIRPFGAKAQRKVLDLLRLLVSSSAADASTTEIADILWPDADGDAAQSNLRGTVKRLRGLLGNSEAVRHFDGRLSLNTRLCWVDLHALETLAIHIRDPAIRKTRSASEWEGMAFDLYRGPFLRTDTLMGVDARRRAERRRFVRILDEVAQAYEMEGLSNCVPRLRHRALDIDGEIGPLLSP